MGARIFQKTYWGESLLRPSLTVFSRAGKMGRRALDGAGFVQERWKRTRNLYGREEERVSFRHIHRMHTLRMVNEPSHEYKNASIEGFLGIGCFAVACLYGGFFAELKGMHKLGETLFDTASKTIPALWLMTATDAAISMFRKD